MCDEQLEKDTIINDSPKKYSNFDISQIICYTVSVVCVTSTCTSLYERFLQIHYNENNSTDDVNKYMTLFGINIIELLIHITFFYNNCGITRSRANVIMSRSCIFLLIVCAAIPKLLYDVVD